MSGAPGRPAWLAVAMVVGLAMACASGRPAPEWVSGTASQYPETRYAVGIGANVYPDRAEEMALAAIAEQTGGEAGAEIVDAWYDDGKDTHWALAVLDKQPILEALETELSEIDRRIDAALAATGTDAPHELLPRLSEALASIPARDRLRERIAKLGGTPSPDDDAAAEQAAALVDALARIKRELRIEVWSWEMDAKTGETGDALAENRRALTQKVLALGFTPGSTDTAWGTDPVWLRVESKVAFERLHLHPDDTLVAVHWDASVEITDVASGGDVVAVLTEEGRAVHLNETEATRQADADARDFAAAALEGWLSARSSGGADR